MSDTLRTQRDVTRIALRVDDPALSQLVEAQLRDIEKDCYELVRP